jgi:hypothetical protein
LTIDSALNPCYPFDSIPERRLAVNKPTIPQENSDLLSLVNRNDRRFLVKWLIFTALCLIPAIAVFPYASAYYGVPVALLLLLGFIVFPFLICGGWDVLTDRGFSGTVESLDFSVRLEMHRTSGVSAIKGTRKGYHSRSQDARQTNYCAVLVTTDEGKTQTLTLRLPGDTDAFPLKAGDRIVKYRGLPYPAIVGCKTPFCAVCGNVDDDGKGECRSCGCSLIVLPPD